jgi:hypothetical protein
MEEANSFDAPLGEVAKDTRWTLCVFVALLTVASARLATMCLAQELVILSNVEDDYFYYYVIADKLLRTGALTFDGIEPTNGFHPLWMAVVLLVRMLVGANAAGVVLAMQVVALACVATGALGVVRYVERRWPAASAKDAAAALAMFTACAFWLARTGMEVALCFAVMPWLMAELSSERHTFARSARVSVLAVLLVLSRVDALMIAAPLVAVDVIRQVRRVPRRWPSVLALAVLPWLTLAGYFLTNHHCFGDVLPQSAVAKALATGPGPYWSALRLFRLPWHMFMAELLIAFSLLAAAAAFRCPRPRWQEWLVIAWPFGFLASLCMRSPWPLWRWYLYPIAIALPVAFLCTLDLPLSHRLSAVRRLAVMGCVAALEIPVAGAELKYLARPRRQNSIVEMSKQIAEFGEDHPGTYAMGDRAGSAGALLNRPLRQLEGLVGGWPILEAIRQERDLLEVLSELQVRYYIATDPVRDSDGCYHVAEPSMGGEHAKKMRSRVCRREVFQARVVEEQTGKVFETYIFEI